MTNTTATAARELACTYAHNLMLNVDACGGDWLRDGFAQTARAHKVDVEALRNEVVRIARLHERHETADKLADVVFTDANRAA
ncbi:hypothetical protein BH790_gp02 [Gordonia phage Gsput1]|uniref:Uncharacterized protein n=1 Tax=Gordonia phage Gsput1 TaxID=1622193 RepID=A0A0E3X9Z3_9CAUD|nr:hypothetical protein BH790_gp02 [Gordonia phage Gsput1]AKC03027.1 hypothetical protein Gsput1_02 [Gordonia phage Gsput1]